jgi:hypothetical protein
MTEQEQRSKKQRATDAVLLAARLCQDEHMKVSEKELRETVIELYDVLCLTMVDIAGGVSSHLMTCAKNVSDTLKKQAELDKAMKSVKSTPGGEPNNEANADNVAGPKPA